ncbi:hypothetical protein GRZ55_11280 [Chelativorans sp. ZYF759]|uniref:helix-turn-helix domain-containing protein n=1 Tax=Chelativorans sp. ZYF759 TaxID=2692213 RepID=UPI00145F59A9|nr:helix-turn-helix domain-containing protein [Chelativorans sp. ZYF759]NMG39826.1 hypothetical protein [Chelativorans sp. ZYF759]
MSFICPCCGSPIAKAAPIEALDAAALSPQERRVVVALAGIYPRSVERRALIDTLYFDDPNGGPECANNVLGMVLARLRKKLPSHGWTIPKNCAGAGSNNRYRLVAVSA